MQGNNACQTDTGVNWANVFASINSNYHFLKNNVVRVPDAVAHPGYIGYVNLNPRTAICYNADYVFFVVWTADQPRAWASGAPTWVTGPRTFWARPTASISTAAALPPWSSTASIKNVPSDGSARPVCNGVMMVNVQPKVQTSTFTAGMSVTTTGSANVRLGPGTNYGNFSS